MLELQLSATCLLGTFSFYSLWALSLLSSPSVYVTAHICLYAGGVQRSMLGIVFLSLSPLVFEIGSFAEPRTHQFNKTMGTASSSKPFVLGGRQPPLPQEFLYRYWEFACSMLSQISNHKWDTVNVKTPKPLVLPPSARYSEYLAWNKAPTCLLHVQHITHKLLQEKALQPLSGMSSGKTGMGAVSSPKASSSEDLIRGAWFLW